MSGIEIFTLIILFFGLILAIGKYDYNSDKID